MTEGYSTDAARFPEDSIYDYTKYRRLREAYQLRQQEDGRRLYAMRKGVSMEYQYRPSYRFRKFMGWLINLVNPLRRNASE